MHEACLSPLKKAAAAAKAARRPGAAPPPSGPAVPPTLAATTFVYRIFGGRLRSQIRCEDPAAKGTQGEGYTSSTYDPFLDLSLEINRASSLDGALRRFTAAEVLDGDNRYRLPKEVGGELVRATKRITIEEAPNVLTVHLKRFEFGGRGHKVTRRVEFLAGAPLDLGPYMSSWPACGAQLYDLYAVLVHHGHSLHSGHYTCYVRAPGGGSGSGGGGASGQQEKGQAQWHLCDDHSVYPVSQRQVEAATHSAYMLFFTRRHAKKADECGAAGKSTRQAAANKARAQAPDADDSSDEDAVEEEEARRLAKKMMKKKQKDDEDLQPPALRPLPAVTAAAAANG
jgi:ubiquitin carboxyl-terminal hydrolase 36/42